jgi:hypothetical protein
MTEDGDSSHSIPHSWTFRRVSHIAEYECLVEPLRRVVLLALDPAIGAGRVWP